MNSVHLYVDMVALGVALIGLIPIYQGVKPKLFSILLAALLIFVIGAGIWINHEHKAVIEEHRAVIDRIERLILDSLGSGPKTFDELAHDLNLNKLETIEALDAMEDAQAIHADYVALRNCDGSIIVQVKRYFRKPKI